MKKPIYKRWWFWVIAVVIVCGVASNLSGKKKDGASKTASSTETKKEDVKKESKEDTKITYDNFLKIKMGQKYEDVVAVLGDGKQQSSSEVSGIKTVMYTWKGSGASNMNVTIQNGAVTGKAQLGLKKSDSKITLDKFNQVKEGMSYDQVKDLLGEGQVISQTKIMDAESTMYSWMNKDGSNANCTFSGGKLQIKAQVNLK